MAIICFMTFAPILQICNFPFRLGTRASSSATDAGEGARVPMVN